MPGLGMTWDTNNKQLLIAFWHEAGPKGGIDRGLCDSQATADF